MDIEPNRPQGDITPGRPNHGNPQRPRPLMDDFGPRRPATPTPLSPRPVQAPNDMRPMTPPPQPGRPSMPPQQRRPEEPALLPKLDETPEPPKEKKKTGHSGIVGLVVFVVLAALLLSPLLPGKVLTSFPGSSDSSSSGDQTLACAHDLKDTTSTTVYNTKAGSPIVYKYSTTTTLHGTCDGKAQSAVGGHNSQFNPLGGLINVFIALVIAFIFAKIWRLIFGRKASRR